jgi:type II secretory pathway component PulM
MIGRLSGRIAALLAGTAVLVVLLVGWFVLVSPERSKAADLSGQIDQTQAELLSTQSFVKSAHGRQSVQELRKLRSAVPDEAKVSEIIRQLVVAQNQSGIQINSITVTLSVQGHYFNLAKFVDLLQTRARLRGDGVSVTGRLYAVDGIQFGSGGSGTPGSSAGLISATINLNAFVFGGSAPVAPTSTDTTSTNPTETTSTSTTTTTGP